MYDFSIKSYKTFVTIDILESKKKYLISLGFDENAPNFKEILEAQDDKEFMEKFLKIKICCL